MEFTLSDALPIIVALVAVGVHWGVAETRIRGLQHQVDEIRQQLTQHLTDATGVKELLARLDERTAGMADRMERIENRMNGEYHGNAVP